MPPASLPALAAISPGPSRARRRGGGRRAGYARAGAGAVEEHGGGRYGVKDVLGPPSNCRHDHRSRSSRGQSRETLSPRRAARSAAASPSGSTTRARRRPSPRRPSVLSSTTGRRQVVVGHQPRDLLEVGVGAEALCDDRSSPIRLPARRAAARRAGRAVRAAGAVMTKTCDAPRGGARASDRSRASGGSPGESTQMKSGLISPPAVAGS